MAGIKCINWAHIISPPPPCNNDSSNLSISFMSLVIDLDLEEPSAVHVLP